MGLDDFTVFGIVGVAALYLVRRAFGFRAKQDSDNRRVHVGTSLSRGLSEAERLARQRAKK